MTVGMVYEAVRKSNIDVGAMVVESNNMEFIIRGLGFIKNVTDIENIIGRQLQWCACKYLLKRLSTVLRLGVDLDVRGVG